MTPRDMTPDEREVFEEEVIQHSDELPDHGPSSEPEVPREVDRDRDGLPDDPAKYRVPS